MLNQSVQLKNLCVMRLKDVSHKDYQECVDLTIPMINDTEKIMKVIEMLLSEHDHTGDNFVFMVAIVYRLFFPYKNYNQNMRIENGIRELMRAAFGFNSGELVNHYGKYTVSAMKGARYRQRVEDEAIKILSAIAAD